MTTIAVGDIHGNLQAVKQLLNAIDGYRSPDTTVVFLGDYLDRGPDTRGLLELLIQFHADWPGSVVFIEGNHEQWFLDSIKDHSKHAWLQAMEGLEKDRREVEEKIDQLRKELKSSTGSVSLK